MYKKILIIHFTSMAIQRNIANIKYKELTDVNYLKHHLKKFELGKIIGMYFYKNILDFGIQEGDVPIKGWKRRRITWKKDFVWVDIMYVNESVREFSTDKQRK